MAPKVDVEITITLLASASTVSQRCAKVHALLVRRQLKPLAELFAGRSIERQRRGDGFAFLNVDGQAAQAAELQACNGKSSKKD